MAVRVLWFSRHPVLPVQRRVLEEKLGDVEIIVHDRPISTAERAVELVKMYRADYVVPVLPLSFTVRLVERAKGEGFTVLYSEMEHVHN